MTDLSRKLSARKRTAAPPRGTLSRDLIALATIGLLTVVVIVNVSKESAASIDWLVVASFAPALVGGGMLIVADAQSRAFSLHVMHGLFVFVFLGVAPLSQYLLDSFPRQGMLPFTAPEIITTNAAVALWIALYWLAYKRSGHPKRATRLLAKTISIRAVYLGFVVSLLCLGYLASVGFLGVLTRGGLPFSVDDPTSSRLVTVVLIRAVPYIGLYAATLGHTARRDGHRTVMAAMAWILFAGNLVTNNPLAAPRFWTAMVLIGIITTVFLRKHRGGGVLIPILLLGLFLALPVLNRARRSESADVYFSDERSQALLGGDYDAYSMLLLTRRYVADFQLSWGKQLVGSTLFFVPRSLWSGKPVGSGSVVAEYYNFPNTNVSSPLPAEAIINFGILGIPLFAWFTGRLLRRLDDAYWNSNSPERIWRIDLVYPLWLGMLFFLLRGDLMSSLAFATGTTVAAAPFFWPSGSTLDATSGVANSRRSDSASAASSDT